MTRRDVSDWVLIASVALGLAFSWALPFMFVALLLRIGSAPNAIRWHAGHALQVLSVAWGVSVIVSRGVGEARALVLQYMFIWTIPLLLTLYQPDHKTVGRYKLLIYVVFALDMFFNLYAFTTGNDLLGRVVDARSGLAGGRYGGLFSHSFYSGSISILAYAALLSSPRYRLLALLAVANLLLAGSWRLLIAIVLIPILMYRHRQRSNWAELFFIMLASVAIVALVFATSSLYDIGIEPNPSNDLRIVAWLTAIDKGSLSPWIGVGFPNDRPDDGVGISDIDDLLIAESWYLTSLITFGLPYMLLRIAAYILTFYRNSVSRRGPMEASLIPFTLIDMTYGGFFEGTLVYTWIWILVMSREQRDSNAPESPRNTLNRSKLRSSVTGRTKIPYA